MSRRVRRVQYLVWVLALAMQTSCLYAGPKESRRADWPQWRGPNRNGISSETGILNRWSENGPPLAWTATQLGGGFSSLAVADGRIFTMGQRDKETFLIALNEKDGTELWRAQVGSGDPNCTPTVDGDRVYALGRGGDLLCAKTSTGEEVWRKNFGNDFGGEMMSGWGYSESPLVDGERLICTPGSKDAVIVSLDKRTGDVGWKASLPEDIGSKGRDGAGYSSAVISEAGGVRQYIQLIGRGVISVATADGRFLWSYNRIANGTANIPTSIVKGDYVFCSTGYGTGSALLKVVRQGDALQAEEVYFLKADEMQNHHGGMVLVGDYIYCGHGHNQGFPICLEMETGKFAWRPGRGPGKGSAAVVYADGHLYFRYEDGVMALVEATPEKYLLKGSFKAESLNGKAWALPVIAAGRLYLRDQGTLLSYKVK